MDYNALTRPRTVTDVPPTTRRSERIFVSMPITLRLEPETAQVTHSASTVDLSEMGARVRTDAPLAPGQALEVIPSEAGSAVPSRVVWVGPAGSAWAGEAGLEFLQSLSAPV